MVLSATFKNPTCPKAWIDGSYLCWQASQKGKVLTKDFLKGLATLENSREALIGLFEQCGPLWAGEKIFCAAALSEMRGYQLLWLLVEGVKAIGQPRQHQELMDKFFTPLENWEQAWNINGVGKYMILPADFEKDPIENLGRVSKIAVTEMLFGVPPKKTAL